MALREVLALLTVEIVAYGAFYASGRSRFVSSAVCPCCRRQSSLSLVVALSFWLTVLTQVQIALIRERENEVKKICSKRQG